MTMTNTNTQPRTGCRKRRDGVQILRPGTPFSPLIDLIIPLDGFGKADCHIMYCSRNAKENKEMSRSAYEAAAATKMDKVRPSFSWLSIMDSSSAGDSFFCSHFLPL